MERDSVRAAQLKTLLDPKQRIFLFSHAPLNFLTPALALCRTDKTLFVALTIV